MERLCCGPSNSGTACPISSSASCSCRSAAASWEAGWSWAGAETAAERRHNTRQRESVMVSLETQDPLLLGVVDEHRPVGLQGQGLRLLEGPGSDGGQDLPLARHHDHAPAFIRDVEIAEAVDRDIGGITED